VLSLAFATSAFGATITIGTPDSDYLARTTKIDFSGLENGDVVTSVTDDNVKVDFDQNVEKLFIDGFSHDEQFAWWGYLPNVEETTANVLATAYGEGGTDPQIVTMNLSKSVRTFGFEMAPRWGGGSNDDPLLSTVTFRLYENGDVVGVVNRTVTVITTQDNYNALLFAISSDVAFDEVEIAASYPAYPGDYGLLVGQLRYSEAEAPIVSGTVTSADTGIGVPFSHVSIWHGAEYVTGVDADYAGRYSVALPPATYTFNASGPGWDPSTEEVTVPDEPTFTQDLTLDTHHEQAIYRFFNMKGGVHFYTASDEEFINVYRSMSGVFHYDGIAYFVPWGEREGWTNPNTFPLYRFFNRNTGVHFYTMSEAEKNNVIATRGSDYTFEGVAYYVSDHLESLGATGLSYGPGFPVYRFYVPLRDAHFFTADSGEVLGKGSGLSNYYHYEGVGFYINQWQNVD